MYVQSFFLFKLSGCSLYSGAIKSPENMVLIVWPFKMILNHRVEPKAPLRGMQKFSIIYTHTIYFFILMVSFENWKLGCHTSLPLQLLELSKYHPNISRLFARKRKFSMASAWLRFCGSFKTTLRLTLVESSRAELQRALWLLLTTPPVDALPKGSRWVVEPDGREPPPWEYRNSRALPGNERLRRVWGKTREILGQIMMAIL